MEVFIGCTAEAGIRGSVVLPFSANIGLSIPGNPIFRMSLCTAASSIAAVRTSTLLPLAVLAFAPGPQEPSTRPAKTDTSRPVIVDAGPLRLEICISRTATLFHVVDQISGWSEYCHSQYRTPFVDSRGAFNEKDTEMLEAHKRVRGVRGWGGGLEQAFYTDLDLNVAIDAAVSKGNLTKEQAETERVVLLHFSERVGQLFKTELPRLSEFRDRVMASGDELREFATKVSRFCCGVKATVPAYLIANPSDRDFGGGYNGERLTLELPRAHDAFPTLLHELMHAFVNLQKDKLLAAVNKHPTLDFETLNEGIAYALSPGLYHSKQDKDPLAATVAQDVSRGLGLDDNLARCRRFGLALRPLLREALADEKQTIDTFLPRALDAWSVMRELNR